MEELECDLVVEFVSLPRELEVAWWAGLRVVVEKTTENSFEVSVAETERQE